MSRPTTLLLLLLATSACKADESEELAAEANRKTTNAAGEYRFYLSESESDPLKFQPKSLLRWSNPIIGEIHGNVFLWTHNGRPQVIGSLLQWYSPHKHGTHEFHSLSSSPVRGYRNGSEKWITSQPGLQFFKLRNQLIVPDERTMRLRKMRAIARGFRITSTDRHNSSYDLRLLTQPVFRYGAQDELIDGAIFIFVQGTDPEVILLVEARREDDSAAWHVALAQMANLNFVAEFGAEEVWRVKRVPYAQVMRARDPYVIIRVPPDKSDRPQ